MTVESAKLDPRRREADQGSAYRGPETGHRDHASYALAQGLVRIVLTWSLIVETESRWPWQPREPEPASD